MVGFMNHICCCIMVDFTDPLGSMKTEEKNSDSLQNCFTNGLCSHPTQLPRFFANFAELSDPYFTVHIFTPLLQCRKKIPILILKKK